MADTYPLEVVTPERVIVSEEVSETIAPGSEGYLGVLAGHVPLMTLLVPGEVRAMLADGRTTCHIVVSGGFMEVARDRTTILADSAQRVDEIDVTRAEADLAAARQMLTELEPGSPEEREALRDAEHAQAQLRAVRNSDT